MKALTPQQLPEKVGQELAVSDWVEVTQARIDLFAEATGDHQFIHVDPEKAARGPFGTTVAHGFMSLSMLAGDFLSGGGMPEISGAKMLLNYGLNRVRFPAPVRVGSRLRSRATLQSVEQGQGFLQLTVLNTIEIEGESKPACTAESLFRVYL
ncbi:MaoC family dehydratase [Deinococcus wulumuqiensis]|uniref:MaoC family dehydratase n=1 Tax=Deinococcus wulumuqiensis TaxID=980427 RepID=A0AAV4K720_9DEIO|nr:MaoC family dehydratase [Deinococcus wulumuqiensis]QII22024.1 MaoC family dehydratase [Deinococcus wulumuqiensis R12]GGI91524.1 MaoC family dehydratase [Deinococcus wulumuqiensis]GGP30996.1 MaoC family dehydratase [Deinococcus wulumuqiensis]